MGMFLNSNAPYDKYKTVAEGLYFVDKTAMLEELIPALRQEQRFFCITRPRRFGKTVMANMIGAFFSKANDSSDIFDKLEIAGYDRYRNHLNQHNVIYIDFSETPETCRTYEQYICRISNGICRDLKICFPEIELCGDDAVWDQLSQIFEETGEKFLFVLDEWDAVFHMRFLTESEKKEYLQFLKLLLKGRSYVELAYMTGVLPIGKYSSGSELNMFLEYNMATKEKFSEYFGFLDDEVDVVYQQYVQAAKKPKITREDLREWYDGYYTAGGARVYNPRSVACALLDNELSNYWTSSGPYDEIFFYIRNDIEHIKDDLALMVSGERIRVKIDNFAACSMELNTKSQIYSAMVVYGLLTYTDGKVLIPNKELMMKYEELLQRETSLGYVYQLARKSDQMLDATLAGDVETMAEILQYAHNTETPILSYNHETELSAVVNLVYLSARDRYRVEREDKAGKGYVDFIFYPVNKNDDGLILELKVDDTPEEAVRQIKEKEYALRFAGKLGQPSEYKGRILAVGIGYNKAAKEHACKVEVL